MNQKADKSVPLTRPRGAVRFMLLLLAPMVLHIVATAAMGVYTASTGRNIPLPFTLSVYSMVVLVALVCAAIAFRWMLGLRRRVKAHEGRLCLDCTYPLPPDVERGVCPECGRAYELNATLAAWRKGRKRGL